MRPRGRRGLTLVETLLALAVLAMIGLTVASLFAVLSSGSAQGAEVRSRGARGEVLSHRLGTTMRSVMMVLDADERTLVLWVADSRANGAPDLSEIRRIEWDPASEQIRAYAAPDDLAAHHDVTYDLTEDLLGVTAGLRGSSSFPGETWASGVVGFDVALDAAAAQSARLVRCRATFQAEGGVGADVSVATALRGFSNGN